MFAEFTPAVQKVLTPFHATGPANGARAPVDAWVVLAVAAGAALLTLAVLALWRRRLSYAWRWRRIVRSYSRTPRVASTDAASFDRELQWLDTEIHRALGDSRLRAQAEERVRASRQGRS